MTISTRDTPWRQGMVLQDEAVVEFGLAGEGPAERVVVVISHDCDIANLEKEPQVEVITGRRIAVLGADANAKTPRRLHIAFQTESGPVAVELQAIDKRLIPNQALRRHLPRAGWCLLSEDLVILQAWLAARYRRSAFPEQFEERLRSKAARKIAKALEPAGQHIIAVFFDVDGGHEVARTDVDDLYSLRVTLLYESGKDEPAAHAAAELACDAIVEIFESIFQSATGWHNIQLLDCSSISDNAMTVAQSRLLKEWRLEYLSLEGDPQQAMLGTV
ncbi:hypothetical protein LJR289_004357 [Pseudoduganella sp. LjRoot289]|uniref:hypothetical protein n=1 Tax=Pseudoduganella sp. LjRoot289 TaxID=3342314 RepID=UPI003ECD8E65